jgi:hypothetical protein
MTRHDNADDRETNALSSSTEETQTSDDSGGDIERRTFLNTLVATGALGAASVDELADPVAAESTLPSQSGWDMQEPQLETPWTQEVGPDNAHPEYPRPQMVRDDWENLNGVWQFSGASEGESPPIGEDLGERILVPYPVESGLSGIKRHETWMWYRRQFEVPDEWLVPTARSDSTENNPNAQRLLLHFERVDWETTVYVNGEEVTNHRGGYDHFAADVTDALVEEGPQEVVVGVFDPTGTATDPVGTQPKGRQGVGGNTDGGSGGVNSLWKTPASGIWDTVWLEPVPDASVSNLDMTPDLDNEVLRLTVRATTDDATVVATAYDDADEKVGRVVGPADEELELPVPDPRLWSPDDPFLYDLDVKLRRQEGSGQVEEAGGGKLLDRVESYFGMRSLGKIEVDGTSRPTLNGEMVYQIGSLDSGYWPDGIYTAPTDEALRTNLEYQKELGYNMTRMHSKLETRRWFYHTDQLGLLVWQDIPNMEEDLPDPGGESPLHDQDALDHFKSELREMVTEHDTHPSMAVWIPFNEGWGIINSNVDYVREVTQITSDLDPERLVDAMSGHNVGSNNDPGVGDFTDVHDYPGPMAPEPDTDRISANAEYTSPSIQFPEHTYGECGGHITPEEFVTGYVDSVDQLQDLMVGEQLSASVYTATTDLNGVCNGHITYDREVIKAAQAENGLEQVRGAHEAIIEQSRLVMGNVDIDVEVPPSYVAGKLLGTAQPFEISATLTNPESTAAQDETVESVAMSVTSGLPDDWTITAQTATEFDAVADGESVTATWEVTPDSVADGDVEFEVVVDYEVGGEPFQYDKAASVSAAQLAYWRFENSPEDDSSYNNPLALQNGAGFDDQASVEADYSMRLDGEDDSALISGSGSGTFHNAFAERTVSMWLNPDSTDGSQVLFNEGGFFNGMGLRINDGTLEAIVKNTGTAGTVAGPFDRTEWTHVAAVFDRGAFRLYVNGSELAVNEDVGYDTVPGHVAGSELGAATTTTPWRFDDQQAHFFGGHVDATAVFELALSASEVEAVATRGFAVDAPTLYDAGSDPDPFTVDATFSDLRADDGSTFESLTMSVIEIPDGWTSEAQTATEFNSVADGESVTATWEVTPDSDTTGSVELEVAVDYEIDGEQRRLIDGANLNTLTSAALAEWRFNGTTEDSSGNGHSASLENGAAFDDQVVVEGSHSVDLTGQDDFIDLAEGGEEFLGQSFTQRTLSMWIKPESTAGQQVLYNEGAGFNGMGVRINDGTLEAMVKFNGTAGTVAGPFDRTEWTHVAVVFEKGAFRLYVNGNEIAENEDVGSESVSGGYWGGEFGSAETFPWDGNFDGHFDASAIYPLALSDDLIATLA